jgi:prespore-specific regulator
MKGRRWTAEEDHLLKESVLNSIISGGTQTEAFEEVGRKLGRTPGACGFRWNAVLRQKDSISYTEAKKKRVYRHLQKKRESQLEAINQVIPMIRQVEKEGRKLKEEVRELSKRIAKQNEYHQTLVGENHRLRKEMDSYDLYQREVKDKYQHLMELLARMKDQAEFPYNMNMKNDDPLRASADNEKKVST